MAGYNWFAGKSKNAVATERGETVSNDRWSAFSRTCVYLAALAIIASFILHVYGWIFGPGFTKEEGIGQVDKLTYVQGEHKQEILKQINEAKTDQEIGKIVSQAQKDNDEIRVRIATQRLQSPSSETPCDK